MKSKCKWRGEVRARMMVLESVQLELFEAGTSTGHPSFTYDKRRLKLGLGNRQGLEQEVCCPLCPELRVS